MKITVIQADGMVGVDGDFRQVDLSQLDESIHAIQFDTVAGKGHVEFDMDAQGGKPANQDLTSFTDYQWVVQAWEDAAPSPEPGPQPPAYPQFTALEMLDLFTEAEQLAVVNATMTNAAVKLWYDRMIAATFVTYEDPRTEGGLQALVDAGLLTAGRKAEIVAAMQPL